MIGEVIFTGTELLLGQILNTNAQYIQQVLASLGIDLYYQVTVGDNLNRLVKTITHASQKADLIIISGGLGPTEDDLSREALAQSLGISLSQDEQALHIVKRFFDERRTPMPANNLKQALVPEGGFALDNPLGTAPGIILEHRQQIYILIPGPPSEFKFMIKQKVIPYLNSKLDSQRKVIKSKVLKLCGLGESMADEKLGELLHGTNPSLAPTSRFSEVHLRITSKANNMEEAIGMNKAMEAKIRLLVGNYVFGTDDETLPEAIGNILVKQGLALTTVETCTGGLLAHSLTGIPQFREFFKSGYVLGNKRKGHPLLANISEQVQSNNGKNLAEQLAVQAQSLDGADICLVITEQLESSKEDKTHLEKPTSNKTTASEGENQPETNVNHLGGTIYIATNIKGAIRVGEFKLWGLPSEARERAVHTTLALLWRTLPK